jgi:PASTA domain
MVARLAVLPRVAIVGGACVLATVMATVTFAASGGPETPAVTPPAQPASPEILVVPDVREQAYVFAKGSLEEAGFAWRVAGGVHGFAANTVVAQAPAAGTRVVDTGMPTISLTLRRNGKYPEKGTPEDASPFEGTPVQLADVAAVRTTAAPAAAETEPAEAQPVAKPVKKKSVAKRDLRKPAFAVPGAPKEPLDEITLDKRARALDAWLAKHPTPSVANVNHWTYQHAWIVTGARFGWSHGAEALRILIRVDRKVEARWGMGAGTRAVAEKALAEVQAEAR